MKSAATRRRIRIVALAVWAGTSAPTFPGSTIVTVHMRNGDIQTGQASRFRGWLHTGSQTDVIGCRVEQGATA